MQLKIQRSQRLGGAFGGKLYFCLDVRAAYTEQETRDINKYQLRTEVIYNSQDAKRHLENAGQHLGATQSGSAGERAGGLVKGAFSLAMAKMKLNISIGSLAAGQHIECKDLAELIEAEEVILAACKNLQNYLRLAKSFDGSTVLIDFPEGGEPVQYRPSTPPLSSDTAPVIEHRPMSPALIENRPQTSREIGVGMEAAYAEVYGGDGQPAKKMATALADAKDFQQSTSTWHETAAAAHWDSIMEENPKARHLGRELRRGWNDPDTRMVLYAIGGMMGLMGVMTFFKLLM